MASYNAPREFSVTPPARTLRLMIALLVALPELAVFVAIFVLKEHAHVPSALQPSFYVDGLIAISMAIIFVLVTALLWRAAQRRRIVLDGNVLDIMATFYRRKQAANAFDLEAARIVDLDEYKQWRPFFKSNGFGIPGLRAGWFRSRSFVKLFCLLTAHDRVLVLPERAGGVTLLSVEAPQQLLDALRAAADASRGNR